MKFSTPIVCDDIRREVGNKRSLIGVYSDRIIFNPSITAKNFPMQMQLGVYLIGEWEDLDKPMESFDCNIYISDPAGKAANKNIFLLKGRVQDKGNPIIIFDFVFRCDIPYVGRLKMLLRVFNDSDEIGRWDNNLIDLVFQEPASKH